MNVSIVTALVWIPNTDRDTYAKIKASLYNWRRSWSHHIHLSFIDSVDHEDGRIRCRRGRPKRRLRVAVVITSRQSLEHLPNGAKHQIIPDLEPEWGLQANVRDVTYSIKGVEVRGAKHFAPGAEVYPHGAYSGDGYERTYVTGRHKETGQFISILMPTERLENWRAVLIEDPIVLFRMRETGAGYWGRAGREEGAKELAAGMNARISRLTSG
jgi:hypothetical protein